MQFLQLLGKGLDHLKEINLQLDRMYYGIKRVPDKPWYFKTSRRWPSSLEQDLSNMQRPFFGQSALIAKIV